MIERIKELASYLMPIPEMAVLVGIDEDELREVIADKSSEVSKAYHLGKAETILEIRKQEVQLAKTGSPVALENIAKYIIDQAHSE
jgi:hypothetical protein